MDMEPRLLLMRKQLSRDLALAFAWSRYVHPDIAVEMIGWAAWVDSGDVAMVAGHQRRPDRPEQIELCRCTDAALRKLGYKSTAPLSIWRSMGLTVHPDHLSAHERLQAISFFKTRGLQGTRGR